MTSEDAFGFRMPFAEKLGITFTLARPDEVRARMPWAVDLCTTADLMHGGAIMALADSVGGACAFLNLPPGSPGTSTIESKTNFLRGVRSGHLDAVARPLHVGRSVVVVETDVLDDADRRVARVTQSQIVLQP